MKTWTARAERHGIHSSVVSQVADHFIFRVRPWTKRTRTQATILAVKIMRRLKEGNTHLAGGSNEKTK